MCVVLCYPDPPTPCFSALIGFAVDLSHLHLKNLFPAETSKAKRGGHRLSLGDIMSVHYPAESRRKRGWAPLALGNTFCENRILTFNGEGVQKDLI